jgi:hypothetical protein
MGIKHKNQPVAKSGDRRSRPASWVGRRPQTVIARAGTPVVTGCTRTIHFVDIENIAQGPVLTKERVARAREVYFGSGLFHPGDLIFLACSKANAIAVKLGWPEGCLRAKSGRDGADFELLKAMQDERIPERFSKVVVASGDGIFAGSVERLRGHGVDVTVISPPQGLSTRLKFAASRSVLIDTDALTLFFRMPGEGV